MDYRKQPLNTTKPFETSFADEARYQSGKSSHK